MVGLPPFRSMESVRRRRASIKCGCQWRIQYRFLDYNNRNITTAVVIMSVSAIQYGGCIQSKNNLMVVKNSAEVYVFGSQKGHVRNSEDNISR